MIGICSTDSAHFAVPTFGRDKMQGTNPFAFAIPAGDEPAFVLDFATTTVTYGKLEVYERKGLRAEARLGRRRATATRRTIPPCGTSRLAAAAGGLRHRQRRPQRLRAGRAVPRSSRACSPRAGSARRSRSRSGPTSPSGITSHFFGAIRIDALRDVAEFKRDMDRELRAFKQSAPVPGQTRVYVAGEIEHENEIAFRRDGIPLIGPVIDDLDKLAGDLRIEPVRRISA